ncbi:4Fe-4S dicluster domain-containing protein [Mycobacterium sp. Y57]|uniref:HgcAB-like fusion protein n=1 Tax=Mycolicibacterium xanthum TaxID=2796469 RepID=UPI001C8534A0|nr:HgcAB-like fusion protein [Mycolicibacterium xanthum]MBX7433688.1 4Fe-4S dicluster domain-containing protein [Mycolicibacterium xanthum]
MKITDFPAYLRDRVLGMLPHRAPTGLIRIGKPDRHSPVLVTGNFTLTVRRLRDALRGHDAWLLVANSKGIDVWCAAGGGHLTHHDIISAIRTSELAHEVDHREIILPQLCATGVERPPITEATGFATRWGPARLEDLPAYLDRGAQTIKSDRSMRFPAWERLEMAVLLVVPMLIVLLPILAGLFGWATMAVGGATVGLFVAALFGLLPWLQVRGRRRFLTFAGFAAGAGLFGCALLSIVDAATPARLTAVSVAAVAAIAVASIDLAGFTPWYGSYINTFHNEAHIELMAARCTAAAECVQVCPRDVLEMNETQDKVEIRKPDWCIQCGACIVQCPTDALRFRYGDGRVVEAPTIRRTRMNMLGRRSVEMPD